MERTINRLKMNGWLALSPLAVFLVTYLASSLVAHDFYKVPIASAFLIASVYAMLITKGAVAERINIFSSGAGNKNVLLMIWIFVMAGAFATTAKAIGSVEATVNLTLTVLPGNGCWRDCFWHPASSRCQSARVWERWWHWFQSPQDWLSNPDCLWRC